MNDATDTTTSDPRNIEELESTIPPVVGVPEASQILGLSEGTLRNRHSAGLPPRAMKVSRKIRYTRGALIEFMVGRGVCR